METKKTSIQNTNSKMGSNNNIMQQPSKTQKKEKVLSSREGHSLKKENGEKPRKPTEAKATVNASNVLKHIYADSGILHTKQNRRNIDRENDYGYQNQYSTSGDFTVSDSYTIIMSILILGAGIWGLFSPVVFGIFTTNPIQAVVHIFLGLAGIYFGGMSLSKGYCIFLGLFLLTLAGLRFIPEVDVYLVEYLNMNFALAYLHITMGATTLVAGLVKPSKAE